MPKRYQKGDRIPVRAQQVWLILIAHAMLKPDGEHERGAGWSGWGPGLLTYGALAKLMGMDPRAGITLAKHLDVIGHYCQQEGLPPLNVIVVDDRKGTPGHGVVETDGFKTDQKKVWKTDWFSIRPPSTRALREVYDQHVAEQRVAA